MDNLPIVVEYLCSASEEDLRPFLQLIERSRIHQAIKKLQSVFGTSSTLDVLETTDPLAASTSNTAVSISNTPDARGTSDILDTLVTSTSNASDTQDIRHYIGCSRHIRHNARGTADTPETSVTSTSNTSDTQGTSDSPDTLVTSTSNASDTRDVRRPKRHKHLKQIEYDAQGTSDTPDTLVTSTSNASDAQDIRHYIGHSRHIRHNARGTADTPETSVTSTSNKLALSEAPLLAKKWVGRCDKLLKFFSKDAEFTIGKPLREKEDYRITDILAAGGREKTLQVELRRAFGELDLAMEYNGQDSSRLDGILLGQAPAHHGRRKGPMDPFLNKKGIHIQTGRNSIKLGLKYLAVAAFVESRLKEGIIGLLAFAHEWIKNNSLLCILEAIYSPVFEEGRKLAITIGHQVIKAYNLYNIHKSRSLQETLNHLNPGGNIIAEKRKRAVSPAGFSKSLNFFYRCLTNSTDS